MGARIARPERILRDVGARACTQRKTSGPEQRAISASHARAFAPQRRRSCLTSSQLWARRCRAPNRNFRRTYSVNLWDTNEGAPIARPGRDYQRRMSADGGTSQDLRQVLLSRHCEMRAHNEGAPTGSQGSRHIGTARRKSQPWCALDLPAWRSQRHEGVAVISIYLGYRRGNAAP